MPPQVDGTEPSASLTAASVSGECLVHEEQGNTSDTGKRSEHVNSVTIPDPSSPADEQM